MRAHALLYLVLPPLFSNVPTVMSIDHTVTPSISPAMAMVAIAHNRWWNPTLTARCRSSQIRQRQKCIAVLRTLVLWVLLAVHWSNTLLVYLMALNLLDLTKRRWVR